MKKFVILFCLFYLMFPVFSNNIPKWKNEELYWTYLEKKILGESFMFVLYNDDIKIQLTGDYTYEDSIFTDSFIKELKPFIRNEKIYQVRSNGNILLLLIDNPDTFIRVKDTSIISDAKKYTNKNDKLVKYYCLRALSAYGIKTTKNRSSNVNGIKFSTNTLQINKDAPFEIRKKLISYYIVNSLVYESYYRKSGTQEFIKFDFNNFLSRNFNLALEFSEIDKYILYNVYSNTFIFKLLCSNYKLAFDYVIFKYGNYSYLIVFSFSFIILILYFLILFRLQIIERPAFNWKSYMLKGMLILQSATILYVLYALLASNLFYSKAPLFFYILIMLVLPNIFNFITLNIIYFLEKVFIRKSTPVSVKLLVQFVVPVIYLKLVVVLFFFLFDFKINVMFISFLVTYGLFMIFIRIAYNFLQFKTQNAIKEKDLELAHMKELQHKAELMALQSRINPHFLYNSLNSIAGLAKTNPAKTEHMALALSDFCRYAINKQNDTFSTVDDEVEMAKTYLEIEKTRFGEKFNYVMDVNEDCKNIKIPRFIIQPLVENAIKHGISKITEVGTIKLQITKNSESLKVVIFDNGPHFSNEPLSGYGLQSIYDKLELLYKGKASINWVNSPEKCIFITIPISSKTI